MFPFIRSFLFLVSLLSIVTLNGQESGTAFTPVRIEIPAKSTDETYQVVPCGEKGLILFFKSLETVGDSASKWYFSFYDQNLEQVWVRNIPIGNSLMIAEKKLESDTLSMLFLKKEKEKNSRFNFMVIRLDITGISFIANTGTLPEECEDVAFSVARSFAFISYNTKGGSAMIQIMDLKSGNSNTYSWSRETTSRISGFTVDTSAMRIRAAVAQSSINKSRLVNFLFSMDMNGKILAEIPIQSSLANRYLRGLDFLPVNETDWLVFGSYGTTPVKVSGKGKKVVESSGFFSCKLNQGVPGEINFINLLELKNSKELLGEKDIIALKKKVLKKNRNLSEYSLDYPLMLHKVFRHKDQFILVAESFAPQYHSESYTDFDFYGRPYVNTYDVFDGYRFNNGIISAYDENGKLVWDNTLEIRNLVTYELNPKVSVFFTPDDEVVLTYLSEGKVASKIVKGNEVLEKLDFSILELSHPGDKLLSETKSRMAPWYGNYFLCSGYQEIKNISLGEDKKRLVFYITKIKYQ